MSLTERSISIDPESLDPALSPPAVTVPRTNPWQSDDVIEPEFENFLAALTQPPRRAPEPQADPVWTRHPNSWREVTDQRS